MINDCVRSELAAATGATSQCLRHIIARIIATAGVDRLSVPKFSQCGDVPRVADREIAWNPLIKTTANVLPVFNKDFGKNALQQAFNVML